MSAPCQRVPALQDGVRHRPAPFHRAAGVVHPRLVKVGGRGHSSHGSQVRRQRAFARQGVLRCPQVALPGGRHLPGGPRLSGRPFHRVVAVQRLLEQRVVIPLRVKTSAHVLAQQHVAVARKEPDGMVGVVQVAVLAVRSAIDQHREPAGRVGPHHVGGQARAVPHWHHHVGFAYHLVLASLGSHRNLRAARLISA